jgi:hypothetical protein
MLQIYTELVFSKETSSFLEDNREHLLFCPIHPHMKRFVRFQAAHFKKQLAILEEAINRMVMVRNPHDKTKNRR